MWLGTTYGVVQSWSDTQVVAQIAAGSASGKVQILQNGVWSNAFPFTMDTLSLTSISPTSGVSGTSVTFTGTGFGASQGSGVVCLGSVAGQVVTWTDTQVVATVASTALTGIARIQQNGAWSNLLGFTVPTSGGNTVTPAMLNMVVGDTHTIQALSSAGVSVTGLTWTSSDPTVVSLSTDDPPILTAVAPGHVTITAGTASADVTVSAGALALGTVIWSNPGDGSGISAIVPAVPSPTGVADVFALQNDGKVQAITSDGTTAWTADMSAYTLLGGTGPAQWNVLADFQGGLMVSQTNGGAVSSFLKLDGMTGQPYHAYTPTGFTGQPILVAPDGTIFDLEDGYNSSIYVNGVDPTTAAVKFSLAVLPDQTEDLVFIGPLTAGPSYMIAGDGYAYFPYLRIDSAGTHLMLLRVNSSGNNDQIHVQDWASNPAPFQSFTMVTNADQGVVLLWQSASVGAGMAVTTGASASIVAAPTVPGGGGGIANIVQAQDGSFVGAFGSGAPNVPPNNMVAFDASGNVRWVVPNDQPQIATADGGVIGQSGTTYDQNGNATGQLGALPTYAWGSSAYQLGSVDQAVNQVLATPPYAAMTYWPAQGASDTSQTDVLRQTTGLVILKVGKTPADCYSSVGSAVTHSYAQRNPTYQAVDQYGGALYHMIYQERLLPATGTPCSTGTTPQNGVCVGQPVGGPAGPNEFEDTLVANPLTGHSEFTQMFWLTTPPNTPYYAAFYGQIQRIDAYQPGGPSPTNSLVETQFTIIVNGNTGLNPNGTPIRSCN